MTIDTVNGQYPPRLLLRRISDETFTTYLGEVKYVQLSERELYVIINALNYSKDVWSTCDDDELTQLAADANSLEARLKKQQSQ